MMPNSSTRNFTFARDNIYHATLKQKPNQRSQIQVRHLRLRDSDVYNDGNHACSLYAVKPFTPDSWYYKKQ